MSAPPHVHLGQHWVLSCVMKSSGDIRTSACIKSYKLGLYCVSSGALEVIIPWEWSVELDPFFFLERDSWCFCCFFLLFLTASPHAQFGQQNLCLCFYFSKSILISLPKKKNSSRLRSLLTHQLRGPRPRGAGLWENVGVSASVSTRDWRVMESFPSLTAPQTFPEMSSLALPLSMTSALRGPRSICTTHVIREHACMFSGCILPKLCHWLVALLPCHETFHPSTPALYPQCSLPPL